MNFRIKCLLLLCVLPGSYLQAQTLLIENLEGPVTQHEINAFKVYMKSRVPAPNKGIGNIWVFGNPGKAIEACGLMYEASKDTTILNRMIFYCDAALSSRNDLCSAANGGQLKTWTGNIDRVWPPAVTNGIAGAGVEQGAVLSHMVYCSRLILETPALWAVKVPDGDPNGYGTTYKQRALHYIEQADEVIDRWILPRFIRTNDHNRYYFPAAPNTYKPNGPAPWNQAFMVTNALVRLVQCHLLLKDATDRIKNYENIIKPNLDFFFENLKTVHSAAGTLCYVFDYAYGSRSEDANHFAYDVEGIWIAYTAGRYGLKLQDLVPFANTYIDIILATVKNSKFVGRLDGTTGTGNSGGDNYVRDEYFYLAEFRPDKFINFAAIDRDKAARSPQIAARLLWMKNRIYQNSVH